VVDSDWPAPVALPKLNLGRVHIWRFDSESVAPETRAALSSFLSPDELSRAESYRFPRDRRAFESRRGALRALLGAYVGIEAADLTFRYSPQGKPSLDRQRGGGLSFNVARTGDLGLFAVARAIRVGIDLEHIRPIAETDEIMARGADVERERWASLAPGDRPTAFFRWWTLKEAYLKATGQGLTGALDSFAVAYARAEATRLLWVKGDDAPPGWTLQVLTPWPGYLGALACEGAASVDRFELSDRLLDWLVSVPI
jgi:4'-phosphopantetheinyl transferase